MEELKNLMPDPQDSLFDDSACLRVCSSANTNLPAVGSDAAQLLDDDDDLFASLGSFGKSFEGKPFSDTFAAAQNTPLPDLGPKSSDFGAVMSVEERQVC